ncbi:MAG: hypothetical protein ACRDKL_11135 [Solirubrobacteraceae bacterium]
MEQFDRFLADLRARSPKREDVRKPGLKPFESWDDLDIPDLTDEERAAFAKALAKD